jgi:sec-independent protein translocase protein TatC
MGRPRFDPELLARLERAGEDAQRAAEGGPAVRGNVGDGGAASPDDSGERARDAAVEAARRAAQGPGGDDLPESDVQMSFFDHLEELRARVVRALYGLIPTVGAAWVFRREILDYLTVPLGQAMHRLELPTNSLHFLSPADAFMAYMKLSLVVGLIAAAPWVSWQAWAFIAPGLYASEKRMAIPFVLASTVCFVGGAAFGYFAVFPAAFETFLSFSEELPRAGLRITPSITMGEYLDFVTQLLLAFGVVFEVPVVVTFLALAGIVDWKQLLRFGRWWIAIAAVLAALLTPPDVGSQLAMLVPLIVLYYLSVLLAFLFGRRRRAA